MLTREPSRRLRWLSACLLAALCGLCAGAAYSQDSVHDPALLVSLDDAGRLLPLRVEEGAFNARLSFGESDSDSLSQDWQYNIYAQFYFPGEDPQIDYRFLGNRRYPRLLLSLDRKAALIWVNTVKTRNEAERLAGELRRQGLEGAFVARMRGDYGYTHSDAQLAQLRQLAGRLADDQSGKEDPLGWLVKQDLQRRMALRVRLLYLDGIGSIDEALTLHDAIEKELGECGMLNQAGGGYRLYCGAYEDLDQAREHYRRLGEISGRQPRVVCINADGVQTRWAEENLD